MSIESATTTIKDKVGEDCGLASTLKFDCGDDGVIFLDANVVPNVVNNENSDAACTVKLSLADLEAMISGDLDPMAAFSLGKLQLDGDMAVAMKLGNVIK
ncbi:MAG: SCP2 sterol-binding domain-containing protein [Nannocystales bacterium]